MFALRFSLVLIVVLVVIVQGLAQEIDAKADIAFNPDHIPLMLAAESNNLEEVQSLLDRGMDVNQANSKGLTAAHMAAHKNNYQVLYELIRRGANLNAQDADGWTPLMTAAYVGDHGTVHLILESNADPLIRNRQDRYAHSYAQENNHFEAAELILQYGMVRAIKAVDFYHMLLFAQSGANINAQTPQGATALIVACHSGELDIVQRLLAVPGIQPNFQEADGWTALMFATVSHSVPTLQALLDFGVDLNVVNAHGQTALAIARQNDLEEAAHLLEERQRLAEAYHHSQLATAQEGSVIDRTRAASLDVGITAAAAVSAEDAPKIQVKVDPVKKAVPPPQKVEEVKKVEPAAKKASEPIKKAAEPVKPKGKGKWSWS